MSKKDLKTLIEKKPSSQGGFLFDLFRFEEAGEKEEKKKKKGRRGRNEGFSSLPPTSSNWNISKRKPPRGVGVISIKITHA